MTSPLLQLSRLLLWQLKLVLLLASCLQCCCLDSWGGGSNDSCTSSLASLPPMCLQCHCLGRNEGRSVTLSAVGTAGESCACGKSIATSVMGGGLAGPSLPALPISSFTASMDEGGGGQLLLLLTTLVLFVQPLHLENTCVLLLRQLFSVWGNHPLLILGYFIEISSSSSFGLCGPQPQI